MHNTIPLLGTSNIRKEFILKKNPVTGRATAVLTAVDDVSVSLYSGQTVGLVGESGSGKSTLGEIMGGLQTPTSGNVMYQGKNLAELNRQEFREYRKNIQFVFQDPKGSLSPHLRIEDIIAEPLIVLDITRDKAEIGGWVAAILDCVGLDRTFKTRYSWELSGGQCQRVAIARALIVRPAVIICDEPVSALDISVQAQILNLLGELQEQLGLTYLFISHDLGVVHHMADEIAVIQKGRIVETGPAEEVLTRPRHAYTQELIRTSTFFAMK